MRKITTHHDGHGLNEALEIEADDLGPGGASHFYNVSYVSNHIHYLVAGIQFQYGPRDVEGSMAGLTEAAMLAILHDRLSKFQAGPYPCEENAEALRAVEEALGAVKRRSDARAERGVLGTYAK